MASPTFSSLFGGVDGAAQVTGAAANKPFLNGDLIVMHGYYGPGERTGPAIALVLRSGARHDRYEVKPYSAEQEYWNHYLLDSPTVTIQLQKKKAEEELLGGAWKKMQEELIEKWSVISALGTVPDLPIFHG